MIFKYEVHALLKRHPCNIRGTIRWGESAEQPLQDYQEEVFLPCENSARVEYDRNSTYAVMTHEAFHQYCFFLFDQSEAHRWFDEGHGDYYGGAKFSGRRAKITSKMPAGTV